jgi:phage shock protein PspC (stress-responsive transcriptional regulator)
MDAPAATSELDRPPAEPEPSSPDLLDEPTDRIVLGVAGYVADGIGVDTLWVRLAFVVLALVGGLGAIAYLALWLVVFGPTRTGLSFVRYVGGAIIVAAIPLLIAGGSLRFVSGPLAVVALLLGLALALWQPRRAIPTGARTPSPLLMPTGGSDSIPPASADTQQTSVRQRMRRQPRAKREPSILGRLTLGLAVIAASVGALIDSLNGGRLHPEQWLGLAALICGVGLLVGAVRGRAWWLIVPALLFAGVGYVTGVMAHIGMDANDAFGDTSFYVNESTPGGSHHLSQVIGGSMWISVDGTPREPVTIVARAAIGSLEISVNDTVSVEIRNDSDHGDLRVNGAVIPDGVGHLGPDRAPDVIVDARLGIGDVRAYSYQYVSSDTNAQSLLGEGPFDQLVLDHAVGVQIDDGTGVSDDGWIVLAYGEALIAPDDTVVVGNVTGQTQDFTFVSTTLGEFGIVQGTLRTPWGAEYNLEELRYQFSSPAPAVAPSTTIVPDTPTVTLTPSGIDPTVPDITPPSTTASLTTQTTIGG